MPSTKDTIYTEPRLSPTDPKPSDLKKDWYVWFRFFDASKNTWKQFRFKRGINLFTDFNERLTEAKALRSAIKEELRSGWNPLPGLNNSIDIIPKTIPEAIDFIMKLKSSLLEKKSKETYKYITGKFTSWLHVQNKSELSPGHFSTSLAHQYMDQLLLEKKYSGRTYNDHLTILSVFFNVMVSRKWCPENPFHSMTRMKTTIGRNLAFTDDEKHALRKMLYTKDKWMYYFSQFIYYCFIRRTELAKLRISDIDLHNKTIIIRGDSAKNDTQESVVIPVGLEPILKEMRLEHYPDDFFVFGRHLFPSDVQYLHVDHISGRHNKFCRKLNMDERKGLYSWKHTGVCAAYYATHKDIYAVMRQLRHRDLTTTMIYLKSLGLIQNDSFRNAMIA
jgi:integrase/recombinase XerD